LNSRYKSNFGNGPLVCTEAHEISRIQMDLDRAQTIG